MFDKVRAAWLTRKAEKINAGRVTAAEFLHNLGIDDATIQRWGSAFGGKVCKIYEAERGIKPPKAGAAVVKMGKKSVIVATYAYRWDELSLLVRAALNYGPIAELVAP